MPSLAQLAVESPHWRTHSLAHSTSAVCRSQVRDYKPGTSRADLEEARAAARAQQGLEPDSDEVGLRLSARWCACNMCGLAGFASAVSAVWS